LADCPWEYNDKLQGDPMHGGITYPVLSTKDLKELPVNNIADKDCFLFMWVTMPMIQHGLDVIKSWGFTHKTTAFVWVKQNPLGEGIWKGLGHYTMSNAELCLVAIKGHPKRMVKNISQIVIAPRSKHSEKPEEVRNRINQLVGDVNKIELFARQKVKGWTCVGNEINGKDIRDVIK